MNCDPSLVDVVADVVGVGVVGAGVSRRMELMGAYTYAPGSNKLPRLEQHKMGIVINSVLPV